MLMAMIPLTASFLGWPSERFYCFRYVDMILHDINEEHGLTADGVDFGDVLSSSFSERSEPAMCDVRWMKGIWMMA